MKVDRPLLGYFRYNIWFTGSGLPSECYLHWALDVVDPERMMYSTNYSFTFDTGYDAMTTKDGAARRFVEQAPLTENVRHAIASATGTIILAANAGVSRPSDLRRSKPWDAAFQRKMFGRLRSSQPSPPTSNMLARDIRFCDQAVDRRWHMGGDPVPSVFLNALSATFPMKESSRH